MAELAERVSGILPELEAGRVAELLEGLGERYRERFPAGEIALHFQALERLSPDEPIALISREGPGSRLACAVVAFDHPSEFAYIAGVFASMGFEVAEGEAFTIGPGRSAHGQARGARRERARIVDCFEGFVQEEFRTEGWAEELASRLRTMALALERGGKDAHTLTRRAVAELAASALDHVAPPYRSALYPVLIAIEPTATGLVRMRVESQDTPFFLFVFGAALSIQGVTIERVSIRTRGSRIEDVFEFADVAGLPLDESARLDDIKIAVLLTKQFTSFLGAAGDPGAAILRFEDLLAEVLASPEKGARLARLTDGKVMEDLARLLGASDFLWEDFLRIQYETLLPMLGREAEGAGFSEPAETLALRLDAALRAAPGAAEGEEEFIYALNEFKDREILHYDLDHILGPRGDFRALSRRLTALAELVVERSAAFAYRTLVARHGEPRTAAGMSAKYAVMGLGKLGGGELGYASDIELLFVYDDAGETDGPRPVENREFFGELVRLAQSCVRARREGIFQVDLRLRPHGASGPLACSLESLCTYFSPDGPAHSAERLALVRMRAIAGDRALGERVERLRDEWIYEGGGFDLSEFRNLRERQLRDKTRSGRPNAKFGPGALVDLEYSIQILQVRHGRGDRRLRTPRMDEAIRALAAAGILPEGEEKELKAAYAFFRTLINGLRMLRGSALDLSLPEKGSEEMDHLARRIGYGPEGSLVGEKRLGLGPAERLSLDFEARTAAISAFSEALFGGEGRYRARPSGVADLVLGGIGDEEGAAILSSKGFAHPETALVNLRALAGVRGGVRDGVREPESARLLGFARLALIACDMLSRKPDPDMAINNWERFVSHTSDPAGHFAEMLAQPRKLEILLDIISASQFLADLLAREPGLLDYVSDPASMRAAKTEEELSRELARASAAAGDYPEWLGALRRFRRREMLRIGARDLCLKARTVVVMEELSSLAEVSIRAALDHICDGPPRFCVIAFGKLGGRELNYSSDIDLLGIWERGDYSPQSDEEAARLMERLRSALSDYTPDGYAYRVDLRLRPYGSSGQLGSELDALMRYYSEQASPWELQALIKARPVAGDLELGMRFVESSRELIASPRESADIASTIVGLRREAIRALSRGLPGGRDVKSGLGGIRDVEFLVQGLQMAYARLVPDLLRQNTLESVAALSEAGILPAEQAARLSEDYVYLRRVEHFLQIYEDRQTHRLPKDPDQFRALARRMMGVEATEEKFRAELDQRFERIQALFSRFAGGEFF
jgi:glutamate-ammonia-ligase adenylyltransferase